MNCVNLGKSDRFLFPRTLKQKKYLSRVMMESWSWIASTEQDLKVWDVLHGMRRERKSEDLKRLLFKATVESVLLYGADTHTLTVESQLVTSQHVVSL